MHTPAIMPPDPMAELEKNRQEAEQKQLSKQERNLSKQERKRLKKERKRKERERERQKQKAKSIFGKLAWFALIAVIVVGISWMATRGGNLPPTTTQGHIERSPPAHIVDQPMDPRIQKHMLEHADGNDAKGPGIIIQYNCDDFVCEDDLIEKLTAIVEDYPSNVYLAPNVYDGKIIMTKLGRREILEDFDEEKIRDFILN